MRSLLAIICLLFSLHTFATSQRDSIGVENSNGKQVILHKVAPKESFYSIGRIYHVSPKAIIDLNGDKILQIGTILRIPTDRPFSEAKAKQEEEASSSDPNLVTYKVGPKETLFSIAKRFNTSVDLIKELNNLKSNNLSIGQLLKVKQGQTELTSSSSNLRAANLTARKEETSPVTDTPATEEEETPAETKMRIPSSRLGLTERTERGVAVWIDDPNLDSSKMLALHATAPVGTIVKITNPMTERVTYAKVVGKFTENETTKDVIIVVTKATADTIGALDKRFQVTIDYGYPNE